MAWRKICHVYYRKHLKIRRLSWQEKEGNDSSRIVSYIRNKGRSERGMTNSVIGEGSPRIFSVL